ncbi:MAG TPA: methionyl-tRNA formyltransferase [Verrucomicrobiae bacterium]|nr:methionyl-tRNA formyltransferase [Verrucomicrobiae bacterium]
MSKRLRTVFFGSGPVALSSLQLLSDRFEVEAIVTKPTTEAEMVKAFPDTHVFAVQNRHELETLVSRQNFSSSFGVLIDFGIIVSQAVIDHFPLGIINSHFSRLPEWRGADPITFSILSGQPQTGVSLMLLVQAMDEGPLLAQAPYNLPASITAPQLTTDLIELSDALLKEVVPLYVQGIITPQNQLAATIGPKEPTYSRKLTKEDGLLDWAKPADVLEREVRAYAEWPHSYTKLAGHDVIVTKAQLSEQSGAPGTIIADRKQLIVCCGSKSLEILSLKPAGKPEMTAQAFLAGYGKRL